MSLVNMKLSPSEEKKYSDSLAVDRPQYPYGLRIDLSNEAIEKLGLAALPQVGQYMTLTARVEVCCVSQYDSKDSPGGASKSVGLQITDMALGPDTKEKSSDEYANDLYGA